MKSKLPLDSKAKFLSKLGKLIKTLRHLKTMSQEDVSKSSGIHRTYISAIEQGNKNITLVSMLKIARSLDTSPGEILDSSIKGTEYERS
ncbi:MAG: helix-turn-helix transcriptional regulator [Patescibacteria group bacterium]